MIVPKELYLNLTYKGYKIKSAIIGEVNPFNNEIVYVDFYDKNGGYSFAYRDFGDGSKGYNKNVK